MKRRKPGEARAQDEAPPSANGSTIAQPSPAQRSSITGHPISPATPHTAHTGQRSEHDILSPRLRRISTSQPDLAHSVMRTVVSSGSDALNLLFEAANHKDALDSQMKEASPYETPQSGPSYDPGKQSLENFSHSLASFAKTLCFHSFSMYPYFLWTTHFGRV